MGVRRYKGREFGFSISLPAHPLVQVVQSTFIRPAIDKSSDTGAPAPLLQRPLVPESGTRALEFHFSSFDQVERICVRKEVIGGLPGMVDPLLNEGSRLRGDGVAMIHGQLPEAAHRPGANFLQGKICGPFVETCLMLGDKVVMVSKPGELTLYESAAPCITSENSRAWVRSSLCCSESCRSPDVPTGLGVGGFAVQCQERERLLASDLDAIPE